MSYEQQLRERIEYLEAENSNLRTLLVGQSHIDFFARSMIVLGLPKNPALLLSLLAGGGAKTKDHCFDHMYGDRLEQPEIKIVDVFICKLRKTLKKHDVAIKTLWGVGYQIEEADRCRLRALLGVDEE